MHYKVLGDDLMLHYCKKCGRIILDRNQCDFCKSQTFPVPEKYWLDGLDFLINKESEQLLREELVKTSPEFDPYLFEHRDEILAKRTAELDAIMAHGKAILEGRNQNIPKCPTCQSTNIKKISGTKRWLTTGLFGLASSDMGKTMQCNNCGYKW